MEQDQSSGGMGQCGADREVFQRVWRRVMPQDRPDCPLQLYSDEEQREVNRLLDTGEVSPPPAQPLPAAQPQPPETPEPDSPAEDTPCLGRASEVYGALLQKLIAQELSDWRTYQAMFRRAPGSARRTLSTMAAGERRHARRLHAAYFLISGVGYWPERMSALPANCTWPEALRIRFEAEQEGAAAYRQAAADTTDPCLRQLYLDLAEEEDLHAEQIRALLERS